MSVGASLLAALADLYQHSWRLVILNFAVAAGVLPFLVAAVWAPLALAGAALAAGPLGLALMHCAVGLARTDELSLRCGPAALRRHWRRGLALGALCGLVFAAGGWAVVFYGRAQAWILVALVLYVLLGFAVYQLTLWPLAAAAPAEPLRRVVRVAAEAFFRRPVQAVVLFVALALVNLAGAAAAVMPLLTLTLAYSALAAAHFTLSPPLEESR